jgi:hypothetical protein
MEKDKIAWKVLQITIGVCSTYGTEPDLVLWAMRSLPIQIYIKISPKM